MLVTCAQPLNNTEVCDIIVSFIYYLGITKAGWLCDKWLLLASELRSCTKWNSRGRWRGELRGDCRGHSRGHKRISLRLQLTEVLLNFILILLKNVWIYIYIYIVLHVNSLCYDCQHKKATISHLYKQY